MTAYHRGSALALQVVKCALDPIDGYCRVMLPDGARPLTVRIEDGVPCLWVLVDRDAVLFSARRFRIAGDGEAITDECVEYIGTLRIGGGVYHVFQVLERGNG